MCRTCAFEAQQRTTMAKQDNEQEKKNHHKWQQLKDDFEFDTCRMVIVIMFCSQCQKGEKPFKKGDIKSKNQEWGRRCNLELFQKDAKWKDGK